MYSQHSQLCGSGQENYILSKVPLTGETTEPNMSRMEFGMQGEQLSCLSIDLSREYAMNFNNPYCPFLIHTDN